VLDFVSLSKVGQDNRNLDQPAFFDRMVLAMPGPPGRSVASPGRLRCRRVTYCSLLSLAQRAQ
jgi:hypothetical protein